jgi:hypothetical protein
VNGEHWAAIVVAVLTLATAWLNHHEIRTVRYQLNGRLEQLLLLTATSSKAEGVLSERQNPSGPSAPTALV